MKLTHPIKYIGLALIAITILISVTAGILVYTTDRNLPPDNLRLVRVESITVQDIPISSHTTTITLNGFFPDSCWGEPFYHNVKIYQEYKLVIIKLWATHHDGVCATVIGYFSYHISLIFPSNGSWTLNINHLYEFILNVN